MQTHCRQITDWFQWFDASATVRVTVVCGRCQAAHRQPLSLPDKLPLNLSPYTCQQYCGVVCRLECDNGTVNNYSWTPESLTPNDVQVRELVHYVR